MDLPPPKISVIIPVRNGMPYLGLTLESLCHQTFRDFEVLVWDNGSTDGTVELLSDWIPSRLKGKVYVGEPLPLEKSLARLVEVAQSPYLARLDADDLAPSQRLEHQAALLDRQPEVAAVGGQMETIDESGKLVGKVRMPETFEACLSALLYSCPLPHPGVMLRREAVLKAGSYRESKPVEDLGLWIRLAAIGRIVNLPEVVVQYRLRADSVTSTAKRAGNHTALLLECLQNCLPGLFPLKAKTSRLLYSKRHPLAAAPLFRVAGSIATLAGVERGEVLRSGDFLYSARCLTGGRDVFSKLIYFWWGRDRSASLLRQVLFKTSFLPGIRLLIRLQKKIINAGRLRRWRRLQSRRGCLLERLEFKGRSDWEKYLELGAGVSIENDVMFAFDPELKQQARLRIGDGAFIGRNTYFSIYDKIEVGAETLIGAYSYICANNHAFASRALPIKDQGYTYGPVSIGPGSWLGTHVLVMPGVVIGEGSVVGAGSVVTKDVPPYEIWAGVPARKIGVRP